MKTNSLLTYLLYALLGFLIIAAGYKACQMQETKKRHAEEEAELQKTLRDLGYAQDDSTGMGSSYGGDTTANTGSASSASGIEDEPAAPATTTKTTTPTTAKTTTPPPVTTKTVVSKPVAASPGTKSATSAAAATASKGVASVAGPGSGRWAVRAGTFSQMEGARRRLEQVIRLGYTSAEISKTSNGQAAVVVYRSNDKNAAIRVVDKLEEKGVDAAVFDRNN